MEDRSTILKLYDELQHDPLSIPPDIRHLPPDDAVAEIKEWFFENFEDPAQTTPYESAEGGYIYIWGGPYDTRDIVENVFADTASDEVIQRAVAELERLSFEWVPNSNRLQSPEEQLNRQVDPEQLHAEMQRRIVALENAFTRVPKLPPGIGHNRPPEPLDAEPLNANDRSEVAAALATLKAQPTEPPDQGDAARQALTQLESKRDKLAKWLVQLGTVFTEEAVKESGKQFGKWAPAAFWLWLMDLMFGVTEIVGAWLNSVTLPF